MHLRAYLTGLSCKYQVLNINFVILNLYKLKKDVIRRLNLLYDEYFFYVCNHVK